MDTRVPLAGLLALLLVPGALAAADWSALTAPEAVAVALERNRDLLQAAAEVRRAEQRIVEARAGALPQVDGSWSLERTLKPNVFVMSFPDSSGQLRRNRIKIGTDYNSSLAARLTQPLYMGGRVGTALAAARLYRQLAVERERQARQAVVHGVLGAFHGALLARELEAIAASSLAQAENHLGRVEARVRAGAATDYDLLRARVNVANLRPALVEAASEHRLALLRLKEAMALPPDAQLGIVGELAAPDTAVLAWAAADQALAGRPDVAAARLTVALQQKAVRVARGEFLPTLAAASTLAYNGNFERLGFARDEWSTYWVAGLNLSMPLFTGWRTQARYRQAQIDQRQAEVALEQRRAAAAIEIEQGVMDLRQALEQIATGSLTVAEAQRAVEIAESLYASGKATQLEVLDAQLALQVARTNLASARFAGTMAEITLRKDLGILAAAAGGEDGEQ